MSLNKRDFPKEIKEMFNEYDREKFCHNIIMLAKNHDFDEYIENEGPIEQIFDLSIDYMDNLDNPKKLEIIWHNISVAISKV